ncbi:CoA transferase [Glutamicibacter sp. NPDC087344]|uniref:CoA transferase n=1 Tax=Glutamicibacter sp. NPDC087344 TaxID=3363994 RepID=UPI0037F2EA90
MSAEFTPGDTSDSWDILGSGFHAMGLLDRPRVAQELTPYWWGGALSVEGLALHAVRLIEQAIGELSAGRFELTSGLAQMAAGYESYKHLRISGRQMQSFAPLSGFFPTADGWIRTHANYPHHRRALLAALEIREPDQVATALGETSALDAQERIVAAGGIAAAVRSRTQWLGEPQARAASAGHWAQFRLAQRGTPAGWTFDPRADLPLSGLKVLDLTRVIAGPTASRTLAALGAQVLRIDGPRYPELLDQHIDTGFGKRSTVLDLATAQGSSAIDQLLAQADVVILGYRPGALEALKVSAEQLQERYPQLVVAQLCAWGVEGPWGTRRGFDSIVQAATGIAQAYGLPNGKPGALPVQALDYATGYGVAASIISLVRARTELDVVGGVSFSLARTAHALFEFPRPTSPLIELEGPRTARRASTFGQLDYVLPPFTLNGTQLDYLSAPRPYGVDEPVWI